MEIILPLEPATCEMDWTSLPLDILVLIAELMVYSKDFFSFCMVCKSWKLVTSILSNKLPLRFPMVMLPEEPEADRDIDGPKPRRFYSLPNSQTYIFELPEASGRKCIPTSHGWLVTVGYDLRINLLHPFTRQQIGLPGLLTFKDQYEYNDEYKPQEVVNFFVNKVTLSKDPRSNPENFMAVAIYGQYRLLGFARSGDVEWTDIATTVRCYEDVIYYKDMFYALDCHGIASICDIDNEHGPGLVQLAPAPDGMGSATQKFLVESSGDLLMVERFRDEKLTRPNHYSYYTSDFKIFRLEDCQHEGHMYPYRWTQVTNLDGRALFVGVNVTKSLPASEGVKPNCIYFSEFELMYYISELGGGGRDTGVFDVGKGTIEPHYAADFHCLLSPPMWYLN